MESIKVLVIKELAQDFLKPPRVTTINHELKITYDYEMDSGEYGEKCIFFEDLYDFRHTHENSVTPEMIDAAYNSIARITNSSWLNDNLIKNGYSHFLIYFDDFGAFEIIAKNYRVG
jgi:hypothetical protein